MIIFAWVFYFFFSTIIATLVRSLFENFLLKALTFSFIFSLLICIWFSRPGNLDISPIISIFFMNLFEENNINLMRLIRPFLILFFSIFFIDLIWNIKKIKI